MITTSTTPPAAMLSKKLFRDGVSPEVPAASATSGITMEAVNEAAARPVAAFSFKEASTLNMPLGFGFTKAAFFDGFNGTDLKSALRFGLICFGSKTLVAWPLRQKPFLGSKFYLVQNVGGVIFEELGLIALDIG
ncbi:unnamed protein product [Malus baccata var. baccata]